MTDTAVTEVTERESGRHPVNVGHLVMGIALLGLVAAWALIIGDVVEGEDVRWLLPAPWVLGGAAGLIALAATGHRDHETRRVGWVAPEDTTPVADTEPVEDADPVEDTEPLATSDTIDSTDTTHTPDEETR